MGYNTTVLVLNDSLGAIEEDPEFGKNLARTIYRMYDDRNSRDVPARNHCIMPLW